MEEHTSPLHLLFFPLMAHGPFIPALRMAKHFASHAVETTIVTTSGTAPLIEPAISATSQAFPHPINLVTIPMPVDAPRLADGREIMTETSDYVDHPNFLMGLAALEEPLRRVLGDLRPDAILSDYWLPWTLNVARGLGSSASRAPSPTVLNASVGGATFVELLANVAESDRNNYGVLVNSFYELELEFADHYRRAFERKAWHVDPLSHEDNYCIAGDRSEKYIKWLNEKQPRSVVYVCFGSLATLGAAQMREVALALRLVAVHSFVLQGTTDLAGRVR